MSARVDARNDENGCGVFKSNRAWALAQAVSLLSRD
jgi:hypothetical protein